jgi:hypothetical protein
MIFAQRQQQPVEQQYPIPPALVRNNTLVINGKEGEATK